MKTRRNGRVEAVKVKAKMCRVQLWIGIAQYWVVGLIGKKGGCSE